MSGYEWERDEADWARRQPAAQQSSCRPGDHQWSSNRRGGGTCINCGDELDREEL